MTTPDEPSPFAGALGKAVEFESLTTTEKGFVARLWSALMEGGYDPDDVLDSVRHSRKTRIGSHVQGMKLRKTDDDGNAYDEVHTQALDNFQIVLSPAWERGPEWPILQPARPVEIDVPDGPTIAATDRQRWLILPDIQGGYLWHDGDLVPIHDEAAVDAAIQFAGTREWAGVILLGDNLDLAELSRFDTHPVFQNTAQAAIDYQGVTVARLRAAVGRGVPIIWLEGNHEARFMRAVHNNAHAAFGLGPTADISGWDRVSIPWLCGLDQWDVEYRGEYPNGFVELREDLRAVHGHYVSSRNTSVKNYLDDGLSFLYGHIHRREWAERTTPDGRYACAGSFGTLSDTRGRTPSFGSGIDPRTKRANRRQENWQTGFGWVEFDPEPWSPVAPTFVPVLNGECVVDGHRFVGRRWSWE